MAEFDFERTEAWNTALRLATSVGRLRVGSNLKASADAQEAAFAAAALPRRMAPTGAAREGGAQVGAYREARSSLTQCAAWLQVLASLMNEPPTVFEQESELAEQCARQVAAAIRAADRSRGRPGGSHPPGQGGCCEPRGPAGAPERQRERRPRGGR